MSVFVSGLVESARNGEVVFLVEKSTSFANAQERARTFGKWKKLSEFPVSANITVTLNWRGAMPILDEWRLDNMVVSPK